MPREPPERGGWSLFHTWWAGFDHADPSGHLPSSATATATAAANGSWFSWPMSLRLEELRDAWFVAPNVEAQRTICDEVQIVALRDLP